MVNWAIRKITNSELKKIVDVHIESLPDDVLPCLGLNVLREYYKKIISDKTQVILGAVSENQLLGFIQISIKPINFYEMFFNMDGLIAIFRMALFQPGKFYLGVMQALKKQGINKDSAEISIIAILPKYQGKSIGRYLIHYAGQLCFSRNIKYLQTKTANELLLAYYIREHSAELLSSYELQGRRYSEVKWTTLTENKNKCSG